MVALLILLTILIFLSIDYLIQRGETSLAPAKAVATAAPLSPSPSSPYRAPHGVFFSPGHTWLYVEESGSARLGVSDLAQSIVGRVDGLETRKTGDTVRKGDELFRLRHGGRTASFRSPVDGVIESVNTALTGSRELRRAEPFTSGWLCKIKPSWTPGALQNFLIGQPAAEWLNRETQRLKVILATIAPQNAVPGATMQDGGLPVWGVIDFVDESGWKQIQRSFFE